MPGAGRLATGHSGLGTGQPLTYGRAAVRTDISPWTNLAIRTLQTLARASGPMRADALAARIPATVAFTGHTLATFEQRGWVHAVGDGFCYANPSVVPSLLDVIEVVEGAPRPDTCVLQEGSTCGAISGERYCALHDGWLRARLAMLDQLAATPAVVLEPV